MKQLRLCFAVSAALFFGCGGCGGSSDPDHSSMAALVLFYTQYQAKHQGQLPPDEKALRDYIAGETAMMKEFGLGSVDDVFISRRDGQPYVVLFGKGILEGDGGGIVAYEQAGKDGQRFVGYRAGNVEIISDEEFRKMVPAG